MEARATAHKRAKKDGSPRTDRGVKGVWDELGPILSALVTGVGLLAFVALFGGAILWDRADQAGLPGTEAVALMPRSVLLSTGSHFLIWAIVYSGVAVALLWLIDTALELWTAWRVQRKAKKYKQQMEAERTGGTKELGKVDAGTRAMAMAMKRLDDAEGEAERADRELNAAMGSGRPDISAQREVQTTAHENRRSMKAEVETTRAEATSEAVEQKKATWKWGLLRFTLLFVLLVGSEVLFMSRRDWLEQEQFWVLLAVSFGTTLLAFAVYQKTHRFSWFAVVAFLGVSAVQGVAAHYEITTVPRVEPAAVLIGGVEPVKGVFVAQTDDRIYLGVSTGPVVGKSARLVAFPRDKVRGLAVGQLTKTRAEKSGEETATKVANKLADLLCSQLPKASTPKEIKQAPDCA